MATCGQMIEGNVVAFMCDLDQGHDGPHRAYENERSVRERAKWEAEQNSREAAETLAQFQGPPETTAERYTENATPPPGVQVNLPPAKTFDEVEGDPVVWTERDDGTFAVRPASPAEQKVASGELDEPTKQRDGDQPLPRATQGEYVQDRIIAKLERLRDRGDLDAESAERLIAQMQESKTVGTQRYGTPLQTFNGRDCLQDAIEEARDLYVYLSSLEQAREAERDTLIAVVARALDDVWQANKADEGGRVRMTPQNLAIAAVDAILHATGGSSG